MAPAHTPSTAAWASSVGPPLVQKTVAVNPEKFCSSCAPPLIVENTLRLKLSGLISFLPCELLGGSYAGLVVVLLGPTPYSCSLRFPCSAPWSLAPFLFLSSFLFQVEKNFFLSTFTCSLSEPC